MDLRTRMNILIVDDKPGNLLTLESLLDDREVTIIRAASGQEALEKLLDHEIALVLLDVLMPDMDGYETAELMRSSSRTRSIPIIFVTAGSPDRDHTFKGYEAGAVDFLYKPIEPVILRSKVDVFLEIHRQRIELEMKTRELNAKVVELEELQQQLEEKNNQLKTISNRDGLTGISNRRHFDEMLKKEWYRCLREKSILSVLMMDIDYFKSYNDHYGHTAGDDALRLVADSISRTMKRRTDTLARYGGEEFVAILPGTDSEGARELAERILSAVRDEEIPHEQSPTGRILTISIGTASILPGNEDSPTDTVAEADRALYRAKALGRNRVETTG